MSVGCVVSDQPRMATGADVEEAAVFEGSFFWFFACVSVLSPGAFLYKEQSGCKLRMNFNAMELEVLVEEVNTHSVKQRNKRKKSEIERKWQYMGRSMKICY